MVLNAFSASLKLSQVTLTYALPTETEACRVAEQSYQDASNPNHIVGLSHGSDSLVVTLAVDSSEVAGLIDAVRRRDFGGRQDYLLPLRRD